MKSPKTLEEDSCWDLLQWIWAPAWSNNLSNLRFLERLLCQTSQTGNCQRLEASSFFVKFPQIVLFKQGKTCTGQNLSLWLRRISATGLLARVHFPASEENQGLIKNSWCVYKKKNKGWGEANSTNIPAIMSNSFWMVSTVISYSVMCTYIQKNKCIALHPLCSHTQRNVFHVEKKNPAKTTIKRINTKIQNPGGSSLWEQECI